MNNLKVELKKAKKPVIKEQTQDKKVVILNMSQFELTKILYVSGILAECNLTPCAKLFLWALCSHYNPNNESMFPSQQTVAEKLGISEKSAQRAVKELKTLGLIDYETKKVNHYVFGAKFFELVKMSGYVGQNVPGKGGQNVTLTNKKEKKEQNTCFSLKKNENLVKKPENQKVSAYKGWKNPQNDEYQNKRIPNAEETRKYLEEKEKISAMSSNPYDYDKKEARKWLENIPKFWLKRSKVADFLIKKYNFSEFKQ